MCIEDIRMGRRSGANQIVVTGNQNQWVLALGPNPRRTRLNVAASDEAFCYIWFSPTAPSIPAGWLIAGNYFQTFRIEEWGVLITQPVWTINTGAALQTVISEVTLEME